MRAKPPSVPSALARREAARNLLAGAVDCRDAQAVLTFTGHWVHRQGMASLPALMAELAQGETLLWWQQLLLPPSQAVGLAPVQAPASLAAQQPAPGLQAHQDPVPSHIVTSSLASGPEARTDPDRQASKAAEIPATESKAEQVKPAEVKPAEIKPVAANRDQLEPVAASEAPAPAATPAQAPTAAKAPVPMATAVATAAPAAPRPAAAQVRRGAATSRPAPAPRNPELARLRAWLPDNEGLGGSSSRSRAA